MFKTTIEFNDDRIKSLLISAFEGGSNYWLASARPVDGTPFDYEKVVKGEQELKLTLLDPEDVPENFKELPLLTRERMENALALMAKDCPHQFAQFLEENEDAITGDVFLQMALLGEIVFG